MISLSVLGRPALVGAALLVSLTAHAALTPVDLDGDITNGHEGVYDDVLNITWLADANYAETSGFSAFGNVNWADAEAIVDNLNSTSHLGVTTWRQPVVAPLNGSTFDLIPFNCDGSSERGLQLSAPVDATYNPIGQSAGFTGIELAYHYYNNFGAIGANASSSAPASCDITPTNSGIDDAPDPQGYLDLFSNIQENGLYWAGTEPEPSDAFYFSFSGGEQNVTVKTNFNHVWPVASGMVGTPMPENIPVLPFWALTLLGLSLVAIRKFNKEV